jgi:hypothetical protein
MRGEQSGDGQVAGERSAPLEPTASRLRRARRQARGWVRHRFKGWAPWLGYVYLALALICVVEESAALGAVGLVLGVPITWACGLWVMPRSEDAYVLAVSNVLQEWGTEVERAQGRHAAESAELATAVLDSLPGALQPELRQRLSDALHGKTTNAALTRDMLFTRLVFAHRQRVVLRATLAQIENEKDDRASEVTASVRRFLDERHATDHEYLDAVRQEQMSLAKIMPPSALRGSHDALVRLCDQYRDAVAVYYEAIEDEQTDSVQQAAEEVCDLWQARQDYSRAMADKLRECFGDSA